jgi:hypothetical protein
VRFLLDESVTGQVHRLLNDKGYEVQRSIDLIGQGQPDCDVAELANTIECILIDSTDFRRLNPRVPPDGGALRYPNAGRVSFRCKKPLNEDVRLSAVLDLIGYEWTHRQTLADKRVILEITDQSVTLFR